MNSRAMTAAAALCLTALGAGAAHAADRNCVGEAEGANGAAVAVTFRVDGKGQVVAREAEWSPPATDGSDEASRVLAGGPNLSLYYDAPTDAGIGPASRAYAWTLSMTLPQGSLRGSSMTLSEADGRVWSDEIVTAEMMNPGADAPPNFGMSFLADPDPEGPHNTDLVPLLDGLGKVKVAVMSSAGRTLAQTDYDLSAKAERDALYPTAWAAALKAAEKPRKCEKV